MSTNFTATGACAPGFAGELFAWGKGAADEKSDKESKGDTVYPIRLVGGLNDSKLFGRVSTAKDKDSKERVLFTQVVADVLNFAALDVRGRVWLWSMSQRSSWPKKP